MADKMRVRLVAAVRSVAYGVVIGALLGLVFFLFAFLTSGFDVSLGLDWARKLDFVLGALCIVIGGVGLLFSGREYRDARIGFAKDEALSSFVNIAGISWASALVISSIGLLLVGSVLDLLYGISLA